VCIHGSVLLAGTCESWEELRLTVIIAKEKRKDWTHVALVPFRVDLDCESCAQPTIANDQLTGSVR
jgi:hypothetical protein